MLPGGLPAPPPAAAQPRAGGSRGWRGGKPALVVEEGALPAAIEPCLAAGTPHTGVIPAPPDPGGLLHPQPRLLAAPWDAAVPCHLLFRPQPAAGCKQCMGRRKLCDSCTGVGGSLCCPRGGHRLPPGTGTGTSTSCCPWAALKRGVLALLAPAPALSLPPELLSLHKYAFINQALFV